MEVGGAEVQRRSHLGDRVVRLLSHDLHLGFAHLRDLRQEVVYALQ